MKIVEVRGTGIPWIINKCKEYGLLESRFEELGARFLVTIYRKQINNPNSASSKDGHILATKPYFIDFAALLFSFVMLRGWYTTSIWKKMEKNKKYIDVNF